MFGSGDVLALSVSLGWAQNVGVGFLGAGEKSPMQRILGTGIQAEDAGPIGTRSE